MASYRGCKWASSNLPKDLAKRVKIGNVYGAISYISVAVALGLAAHVAVKVKDSIMEKQKIKAEQKVA